MRHVSGTRLTGRLVWRLHRKRSAVERTAAEHAAYFARIRLLGQRLVSTREAAELAQVSTGTIRTWARRGLLESRKDARGHNWYREGDVVAAEFRVRCGLVPRAR
jgi:hypothetical protein